MDVKDRIRLSDIAKALRSTPRKGAAVDNPEGARYIEMSDTVATMIACLLERISAEEREKEKQNA